jgi:hypothetical protein
VLKTFTLWPPLPLAHPPLSPSPKPQRQYHFVLQTLTLWSEISTDMFRLWVLAEDDMLRETNGYRWGFLKPCLGCLGFGWVWLGFVWAQWLRVEGLGLGFQWSLVWASPKPEA